MKTPMDDFKILLEYSPKCADIHCKDCRLYIKDDCFVGLLIDKAHKGHMKITPPNDITLTVDEYILLLEQFVNNNSTNHGNINCKHASCSRCKYKNIFSCLSGTEEFFSNIKGWRQ